MGLAGIKVANGEPLVWGKRTYVMGIINLTPDSFSGDGLASDVDAALDQALRFQDEGADFLDLGAESTRPTSVPITAEEELGRLLPALEAIANRVSIPISVDTYKAPVARRAVQAGAVIINDVWGLKADPELADVAAQWGVSLIIMHNQKTRDYEDLLPDIFASLSQSVALANKAGVSDGDIILDPGIGFGKTPDHNLEILHRLEEFKGLGYPLLVGTSRKSTIRLTLDLPTDHAGAHSAPSNSVGKSFEPLIQGTAATVALAIASGADIVRVHDVKEMRSVCRMSDAIVRGWRPPNWKQ
ncbi:MAG: dihydropteroate synthase [SAR202 cluster bacterium Io17-Chloro-G7]|nr:MAG: dihydropteroate synthase [SAR202 cluster bacterium Io17-Chloro-G7]